jgi:hypothetical protein
MITKHSNALFRLMLSFVGLVAELAPKLARGPAGRDDFGPRMGGTLSTHSAHSNLATGASIGTLRSLIRP